MENSDTFRFENDELSFSVENKIALIELKNLFFSSISDLEKGGNLIELINWVEKDPVIDAIMVMNNHDAFGNTVYDDFMTKFFNNEDDGGIRMDESEKKLIRARQMNTFRTFILKMVDFRKITIIALQDTVVTPFFGLSLSFDFRFAADDMKYCLPHSKYGMHPAGALPFFLPRFMGQGEANAFLYHQGEIKVDTAKEKFLIHEVLPIENFRQSAINQAHELCGFNHNSMALTKRLTSNYKDELERYFALESKIIGF